MQQESYSPKEAAEMAAWWLEAFEQPDEFVFGDGGRGAA